GQRTSRPNYTREQIRQEGIAEFTRLYLTEPEQARQVAPQYFDRFEAAVSAVPEVKAALEKARKDIQIWRSMPAQARIRARISTGREGPSGMPVDQAGKMVIDELRRLERAVWEMTGGKPLSPERDPFVRAWLARGWSRKAQQALEDCTFTGTGERLAPGLR